jgi:hypothetical protein
LRAARADHLRVAEQADEDETPAPPHPSRWRAAFEAWFRYFERLPMVKEFRRAFGRDLQEAKPLALDPARLGEIIALAKASPMGANVFDILTKAELSALIVAATLHRESVK